MGKKKTNPDGLMNVKGLAKEWDENEVVRERVRNGSDLLHPESGEGEDIKTVVLNQELVGPYGCENVRFSEKTSSTN